MKLEDIKSFLKDYNGRQLNIMEVCGSHTAAISRSGIRGLLSEKIRLISGPGCPVCVTPSAYIDRLIELGREGNTAIVTFGDLIRVPGSSISLSEARGKGCAVKMVYSPMDVLSLAQKEKNTRFIFAAVGFETTAPVYASLVDEIVKGGINNIRLLVAIKTMPGIISYLLDNGAAIDGLLAPGHVSVVTGYEIYEPISAKYRIPFAVSGFSPEGILISIYDLVVHQGRTIVKNDYPKVVTAEGNTRAQALVGKYFEAADAFWRGVGCVEATGLALRREYEYLDAGSRGLSRDEKKNPACICDKVLMGKADPCDCRLFGTVCTPTSPQGACMVSTEGSCFARYSYTSRSSAALHQPVASNDGSCRWRS